MLLTMDISVVFQRFEVRVTASGVPKSETVPRDKAQFTRQAIPFLAQVAADDGVGIVEQASRGAPHQVPPDHRIIERHSDGKQRIERLPAGDQDQTQADDHAPAGPAVG